MRFSTTIAYPSRVGWIRSSWLYRAFSATHSRKKSIYVRSYSFARRGNIASYFRPYSPPRLSGAFMPAKRIGIFLARIFSMICLRFFSISAVSLPWNASLAPIQRMTRDGASHSSAQSRRERSPAVVSQEIPALMRR